MKGEQDVSGNHFGSFWTLMGDFHLIEPLSQQEMTPPLGLYHNKTAEVHIGWKWKQKEKKKRNNAFYCLLRYQELCTPSHVLFYVILPLSLHLFYKWGKWKLGEIVIICQISHFLRIRNPDPSEANAQIFLVSLMLFGKWTASYRITVRDHLRY